MRRSLVALATAATALWSSACRSAVPIEYFAEPVPSVIGCGNEPCSADEHVRVTYLGVAGFLIEARGHSLLTAPFFSNPSLDSVAPTWLRFFRGRSPDIEPNTRLIDRLLPKAADHASMILVGHGHYDHLLDVPYIATAHAREAVIFGGPSVRHMLMGDKQLREAPGRVVAISGGDVGRRDHVGRWIESSDHTFRIMALEADHAPTAHLFRRGILFADGTVDEDLNELPPRAEDWKVGEPYSYLIDILGQDRSPIFRIYFQDAPNTPPLGFPPAGLDGRRVDLAILCVATARNVRPESPDSLLKVIRPRYVIASHWESFFRPQTLPLVLNRTSDVDAFNTSLMNALPIDARWSMPRPRTTLTFATRR